MTLQITMRKAILKIPVLNVLARRVYPTIFDMDALRFSTSPQYWEDRYQLGLTSGAGSYGRLAQFKAEVLNRFVAKYNVASVLELGCGDGAQLGSSRYPSYVGVDVSQTAVEICSGRYAGDSTKRFMHLSQFEAAPVRADLAMSLDVIYHLVEDGAFEIYMRQLVGSAERFVCVYSSNYNGPGPAAHVRHRRFTDWMTQNAHEWIQIDYTPNPYPCDSANPDETSWADFYFFQRV